MIDMPKRIARANEAIKIFTDGIFVANKIGDKHAAIEMEEFLNELK